MELEKYSMGIGDRFGYECTAQLRALQKAAESGIAIAPVWNKSNREHLIAKTVPAAARKAADEAVQACQWSAPYYIDADHIGIETVGPFLPHHNFFTIDVADYIGKPSDSRSAASFRIAMSQYMGALEIPGLQAPLQITDNALAEFAQKYLCAIAEAGRVYRHIAAMKGSDTFVTEVSVDEAQNSQTPAELLLILAAMAREGIPVQAIAPKFVGSFLKGIDYVGDVRQFADDFHGYLSVIAFAVNNFNLPRNLKLSIHTGSDKFALYPIMHQAIKNMDTGIHLKTAGTTWLEEVAGFAASGDKGLALAKEIYRDSFARFDELTAPYLAVVHIDKERLPSPDEVDSWSSEEFVLALRHDSSCGNYNENLRQLIHVGFKVAADMKPRFVEMLGECRSAIEENVTINIYDRHVRPLFLGALGDGPTPI